MKFTTLLGLTGILVAITVAAGLVHGRWTNRWGHRPDIVSAAERLEQVPLIIGDWQAQGNQPLDPVAARLLQCAGSVNRRYVNEKTGDRIWVAVLLGPAGPIAVHTPEICYSSQNYHIAKDRDQWTVGEADQPADEFWDLRMQGNDVSAMPFRVLYGWTKEKHWKATENPRFSYGGSHYLYKLQLSGPNPSEDQSRDACRDFLTAFLPVLRKHMIDPQ
jgi:hypothetical protein